MDEPVKAEVETKKDSRAAKLKLYLFYILIGGLVISAIISVTSLLIGQFTDVTAKALLTTLSIMLHSLFVLAIIAADKRNRIGKDLLPSIILITTIANIVTSSLGLWNVWNADYSGRAFFAYILLIGAAFIATAVQRLRTTDKTVVILSNISYVFVGAMTLALLPWVLAPGSVDGTPFYFRLVGALAILAATALSVTAIVNRIEASAHHQLQKVAQPVTRADGMLAITICVGVLVGMIWLYGLGSFIDAANGSASYNTPPVPIYYND